MHRIVLYLALAGVFCSAPSVAGQVTGVRVSDGNESVTFALKDYPTVTYTESGVVFTLPDRTVEYPIDSAVEVTFVDLSGITDPQIRAPHFDIGYGEVSVYGLSANETVSVFTCMGKLVMCERASADGALSISIDALPAEPLIIKTDKHSFKFTIRK